ncbi:MAG: type II toxin-antitoxin system death-on-curing family toxin [Candidatus Rokubacteria bacterium]|nr:type II toxin-antitoxin system death-on-curing family toxin [Candidatus Rokubacteria bacterium]
MGPTFLGLEEVLQIHADQIERHGGSSGIRDLGLLESAIAMPQASFGGQLLHADIFEMAAAYLFHIVRNNPFVDGNKRGGTAAALVFLRLNGVSIRVTNAALVKTVLAVAQGKIGKAAVAEFFRKGARK